ncbi:MAG: helix-turn-helix domain-containing protein [Gemmatimonadota bacterium]
MKFGAYSLLLAVAAANSVFLAALLLSRTGRHRGSAWLAVLTGSIALRLMPYILGFAGAYDLHWWLTFAPFDVTLAWGPLLWVYVVVLSTGRTPPRMPLHFAPAAIQLAYQLVAFALPTEVKGRWYSGAHLSIVEPIGMVLVLVSLTAYGRAAYLRYGAWQAWLDDNLSNREETRLGWLRVVLAGFALTAALGIVLVLVHLFVTPLDYFARMPVIVALALLSYLIALLGYRFGGQAIPIDAPTRETRQQLELASAAEGAVLPVVEGASHVPAPIRTADPGKDYAADAASWRARVIAAGWHRDPALTLARLAALLDTSTRSVSRTLNEGSGESFNDFINRIRVEEAAAILSTPGAPDVLRVAFDVGFASKASFNRAFQRHLGTTPTQLRARIAPAT